MTITMQQTLRLFASYLSRNNVLTLKVFLELTKADEIARWEYTDEQDAASALLIDADDKDGIIQLKELANKNKHQVLIAFGNNLVSLPSDVLGLPRPLRSAELIPVLRQASKQFLDKSFQEQKAISPSRASQLNQGNNIAGTVDVAPEAHRVLNIIFGNQGKIIQVIDRVNRSVFFDISHRRYYTANHNRMEIEDLLASPAASVQFKELDRTQFLKSAKIYKAEELDPPLWTAALAISNGKLFDGLFPVEFYRLNRWPDLKKLGHNPLHLMLTALVRRGGTIDYFANSLKVSSNDVVDYINACYTLNYLERQENTVLSAVAIEQKPSNTSKRSLFSRIRSRLGI